MVSVANKPSLYVHFSPSHILDLTDLIARGGVNHSGTTVQGQGQGQPAAYLAMLCQLVPHVFRI